MSPAPITIAVAGCGRIARAVHLPELSRLGSARVVALADTDPGALAAARRLVPHADAVRDVAEICARADVDAVLVCLPSHLHANAALAVLAAGKALYLEKPIAMNLDEARAVVEAGRRAARPATMGFNYRFHPAIEAMRARVTRGEIGALKTWRSTFSTRPMNAPAWKQALATGGGVALDLLSHHVDLLRFISGQEIREVVASTTAGSHSEEEAASVRVTLESGAEAHLEASWATGEADVIEVVGDAGTLSFDRHRRTGLAWVARRLGAPQREPSYGRSLSAFVDSIRTGTPNGPTLEDGLRSLEVVLAIRASAATRQPRPIAQ